MGLLLLLLLSTSAVEALQIIEVADGETALGKVSAMEMTRIAIYDGRIVDLWGPPNSLLEISKDDSRGQAFVRLTNPAQRKPVNLFVADEEGRIYTLILTPDDVPADSVMIKPRGQRQRQAAKWERTQPYTTTLKRLVVHMARDMLPDGYAVEERGSFVPLWNEVTLRLDRQYSGGMYAGEVYTLTNISSDELVMQEQEFYRPGVVAVAIERTVLTPNDSTRVYVVSRQEGNHE